ncbi:MAG: imidazole glycerol phosphate synthase subunit HisH [bacterium]|nr:imidazole glycerol phosphate synthase subunit HisH [bacterium]
MLAVIDYGAGNLRSVLHALDYLKAESIRVVRHPHELQNAEKIILPGVGAFGAGMQQLEKQGLVKPIRQAVAKGVPYLGICVGMQFLFSVGEEMGEFEGLGILPGRVVRFPTSERLKVPHIGWNELQPLCASPLLANVPEDSYAYFVHSYHCVPEDKSAIIASVDYGGTVAAAVQHDNIYGVQFHPEKSQRTGLQILQNFLTLA